MATNIPTTDLSCVVCLGSSDLKTVVSCGHGACSKCLKRQIENNSNDGVFSCPRCLAPCPIPAGGVNGLPRYMPHSLTDEEQPALDQGVSNVRETVRQGSDAKCTVCRFNGKEEKAVMMCKECGYLFLCKRCCDIHDSNQAPKKHDVKELQRGDQCKLHGKPCNIYCNTCSKAVCPSCVILSHRSHSHEGLDDLVASKKAKLQQLLTEKKEKLREYENRKTDLLILKDRAKRSDKKNDLLEAIEHQAEKIMDSVPIWKDENKKKVRSHYEVVEIIESNLKDCKTPLMKVSEGLKQAGNEADDIIKIDALIQEIENITIPQATNIPELQTKVAQLDSKDITFIPSEETMFGEVKVLPPPLPRDFQPRMVSQKTLTGCPENSNIRFICMLGEECYAVALHHKDKTFSVYIIELPIHTLKHKIGVQGMPCGISETPDGHLAILSQQARNQHIIHVYNTDTGANVSTIQLCLQEDNKCCDMVVTPQYLFAILCRYVDCEIIVLVDKTADVKCEYLVDTRDYDIPEDYQRRQRITSGGEFIYIMGKTEITKFKISGHGIRYMTSTDDEPDENHGLAATARGDLFVTKKDDDECYLLRFLVDDNLESYVSDCIDRDYEYYSRLATKDGRIILTANNKTITVFKA